MLELLPDVNIQGQFGILERIMTSPDWRYFWDGLQCVSLSFAQVGLVPKAKDDAIWKVIRERDAILITGNRNSDGPKSLGAMINLPESIHAMPVMTIADPERIRRDRTYAHKVVESLYDYLQIIENYRGVGRLYLP